MNTLEKYIQKFNNTKNLGWHDYAHAYDMSKHIVDAVYAIAYCEEKPSNDILPCYCADTIYIGMSNGYFYDKKNKKPGTGKNLPYLNKRFIAHNSCLNDKFLADKDEDNRYRVFHNEHPEYLQKTSLFSLGQTKQKKLYYSIIMIEENSEVNSNQIVAFTDNIEKLYICQYAFAFNKVPLMNLQQLPKHTRRKNNSKSARQLSGAKLFGVA